MRVSKELGVLMLLVSGEYVTREQMLRVMYGHDPEGGPLSADQCVNIVLSELKDWLRPLGYDIEAVSGYVYGLNTQGAFECCRADDESKPISGTERDSLSLPRSLMRLLLKGAGRSLDARSTSPSGVFETKTTCRSSLLERIAS